jgi:hypothetical protein|tara:strand:- start:1140 stop:1379 length:240 start_codon:yes stop_codon:yes gene_type:complete
MFITIKAPYEPWVSTASTRNDTDSKYNHDLYQTLNLLYIVGLVIDPALMAFAVWDGVKEARNGRKVISVRQRFNRIKLI